MSSPDATRTARRIANACLLAIGVLTVAHLAMGPAAGTIDDHGAEGMADRLDVIGGGLTISSAPGEGTIVAGRVPVERVTS